MNKFKTFEAFLASQTPHISLLGFLINLLLTALLTALLSQLYVRYGRSLSNRQSLAGNFVLIGVTTMFIITVVKSSLALSLGLVGALSIVRFRTAIKEPEELAYLFYVIAIGLGFGAGQRFITLLGFLFIFGIILIRGRGLKSLEHKNLQLSVTTENPGALSLDKMIAVLKGSCTRVDLKRFDESQNFLEASFLIEFENHDVLSALNAELKSLDQSVKVSLLDFQNI